MSRKSWEKTPIDKEMDKKAAKKAGMPVSKYEGSKADRKSDAREMKKLAKADAKKGKR
jgi:hypothetical protein